MADESQKWLRIAGITAVIGALIGMVGDVCLLYAPNGGYLAGDFEFLRGIPNARLIWGHYLGIVAIPLEAAGLLLIWKLLQPLGGKTAWVATIFGFYLMFLGVAYHGGVYPLADAVRAGEHQVEAFRPFTEPLGGMFALLFFIGVTVLAVAIARGKTLLPKWMLFFSPIVTYAVWMVFYFLLPLIGNVLAPTGFNLSMAIFFGLLTWKLKDWAISNA